MSGGHSVIQNNCHYIFIYSFYATPINYHGYNLKRIQANLHLITAHQCEFELIMAVRATFIFKEREKEVESGDWHPKMSKRGKAVSSHPCLHECSAGLRGNITAGQILLSRPRHADQKTCQKGHKEKGKMSLLTSFGLLIVRSWA